MNNATSPTTAVKRLQSPPSLSALAAEALTNLILAGDFLPGDHLIEERLCEQLGVSRPPLREALKTLEHAGLVVQVPRKGAIVTPLTQHDVFEIVTMRNDLEQMAMRLALPELRADRLARCRAALEDMEEIVRSDNESAMTRAGFEFHISVVGLAGHRRLESAYRSMALQLELCMAMNNRARRRIEDLSGNVKRHRELLAVIETGDLERILAAMTEHGHETFLLEVVNQLEGPSKESTAWLEQLRARVSSAKEES